MNDQTQAAEISKEDLFVCGACGETSLWQETYWQDKTPNTPLRIAHVPDLHYRIFCPKCGNVVAEHVDNSSPIAWAEGARPMKVNLRPAEMGGNRIYYSRYFVPYEKKVADLQGYIKAVEHESQSFTVAKKQTLDELLSWLQSNDRDKRRAAAVEMRKFKDVRSAAALVNAFKYQDIDLQHCLEDSLIEIGEPAIQPLIEALNDQSSYVRWRALFTLKKNPIEIFRKIGSKAKGAIPILEGLLKDREEHVREAAKESLTKIRDSLMDSDPVIKRKKWWEFWKN
jgi:hypothetical protein